MTIAHANFPIHKLRKRHDPGTFIPGKKLLWRQSRGNEGSLIEVTMDYVLRSQVW